MTDCCDKNINIHPDHSCELIRINKISGQIDAIKKMISDNRYCPEIMMQLRAVRAAIKSVEANILQNHLAACFTNALKQNSDKTDKTAQDLKIKEITDLFKRYED